jgi:hypothetical protein
VKIINFVPLAGLCFLLPGPFASGLSGGWRIAEYGKVDRSGIGKGVSLTVAAPPGGIRLTQELPREQVHELVVSGEKASGSLPTLRVRSDGGDPQYLPAPEGTIKVAVLARKDLEVMIYGDAPYAYRVSEATLKPCPACRLPAQKLSAAETFAPGWKAELLGDPSVLSDGAALVVSGSGTAQEGLYLRREVDPKSVYRLVIKGDAGSGPVVLRVGSGAEEPQWFPAPSRDPTEVTIANTSTIEVLLYSSGAFTYQLEDIHIRECPSCLTDAALKEQILSEIPDLRRLLQEDRLAAADRLLDWASRTVDLGAGPQRFEALSRNYPSFAASQIYQDVWLADIIGGSCSAAAVFYKKILEFFDFNAFTIDVGKAGTTITHVTTIFEHESKFYLFDPTFNGVYQDSSGRLLDLGAVLNNPTAAVFHERPLRRTIIFGDFGGGCETLQQVLRQQGYIIEKCYHTQEDGYLICNDALFNSTLFRLASAQDLAQHGLQNEPDLILALLRHQVLSIGPTAGPDVQARFIDTLRSHGIRIEPM